MCADLIFPFLLFKICLNSVIKCYLARTYEQRRLIITKRNIFLGHQTKEQLIDYIPLEDVIGVDDMDGITEEEDSDGQHKGKVASLDKAASTISAFQIRTDPLGYNCGRKYCMQAASDAHCAELLEFISDLAKKARHLKDLRTKTFFQRSQDRVKAVYSSVYFQTFSALLILMVQNRQSLHFAAHAFCAALAPRRLRLAPATND